MTFGLRQLVRLQRRCEMDSIGRVQVMGQDVLDGLVKEKVYQRHA